MLKQITNIHQLYLTQGAPSGNFIVDEVVNYLRHTSSHSAHDAADCLGVGQRWLSESMQLFVGQKLQQFILQWRVLQAFDLLDDMTLSFDEVAHRTGFAAHKDLRLAMQRIYQTTPFVYRHERIYRNALYECNQSEQTRHQLLEHTRQLRVLHAHKESDSPSIVRD